jgi:hypothetical protein
VKANGDGRRPFLEVFSDWSGSQQGWDYLWGLALKRLIPRDPTPSETREFLRARCPDWLFTSSEPATERELMQIAARVDLWRQHAMETVWEETDRPEPAPVTVPNLKDLIESVGGRAPDNPQPTRRKDPRLRGRRELSPQEIKQRASVIKTWEAREANLPRGPDQRYARYKRGRRDAGLPLELSREDFRREMETPKRGRPAAT